MSKHCEPDWMRDEKQVGSIICSLLLWFFRSFQICLSHRDIAYYQQNKSHKAGHHCLDIHWTLFHAVLSM